MSTGTNDNQPQVPSGTHVEKKTTTERMVQLINEMNEQGYDYVSEISRSAPTPVVIDRGAPYGGEINVTLMFKKR